METRNKEPFLEVKTTSTSTKGSISLSPTPTSIMYNGKGLLLRLSDQPTITQTWNFQFTETVGDTRVMERKT